MSLEDFDLWLRELGTTLKEFILDNYKEKRSFVGAYKKLLWIKKIEGFGGC